MLLRTAFLLAFFASSAAWAETPGYAARVIIIGIDGVSLNILEPYIEAGVTPVLGRLVAQGAHGHLDSIWPLRTPQVWTSAVTGKLPGQHGIWDHLSNTYFNPPELRTKEKKRVTSEQRRSKALWQLLGERGISTLTVGWMASWPAETVPGGVMVAPIELMGDRRQTTIKGSFYRVGTQMVSPATLDARVKRLIVDPSDITRKELLPFADPPPSGSPLNRLKYLERYVYGLSWSLARARSVEAITVDLVEQKRPEVVLSYFQCPDSLLHRFWVFHEPPERIRTRLETHGLASEHADELHRRFGKVIEACYRDVDQRVGRILEAARGAETLVLIVSDHGFGYPPVPHRMKDEPYSGDHLDEGVILAAGPGISVGSLIEKASIMDLTPTVLHFLGMPVAADMRGKVLTEVAGTKAAASIPTYESAPQLEAIHPEGWPIRKLGPRSARDPRQRLRL